MNYTRKSAFMFLWLFIFCMVVFGRLFSAPPLYQTVEFYVNDHPDNFETEITRDWDLDLFSQHALVLTSLGFAETSMPYTLSSVQTMAVYSTMPQAIVPLASTDTELDKYTHYIIENSQRYEAFVAQNPYIPFRRVIAFVNANIDIAPYAEIRIVDDPYCIAVLTNQNFALPSRWSPSDLVDIDGGHQLRQEAAEMFLKMRDAMRAEGLTVVVRSTYRSYATQNYLFNRAVRERGRAVAERNFARPGHSEHQTGLAVDILQRNVSGFMSNARFQHSREFAWLTENAHEFGFILRYPHEYRHIHRFIFEPWHWRYVGVEIATKMFESDIGTFEEYFGLYLVTPNA